MFCFSFYSDCVEYLVFHFIPTVLYIWFFILFRQCGIFSFSFYSDSVVYLVFHFIPTVLYVLFFILFRQCGMFCFSLYSDSVVCCRRFHLLLFD